MIVEKSKSKTLMPTFVDEIRGMKSEAQWVFTSGLSKRFGVGTIPQCEECGRIRYDAMWWSVRRRVWRCRGCLSFG